MVFKMKKKHKLSASDYVALHLLNCVVCAITIGVLYTVYFG